jgi:hypothetical protein
MNNEYQRESARREADIETFAQYEKRINTAALARQKSRRAGIAAGEAAIGGTLSERLRGVQSTKVKRAIKKQYQEAKEKNNDTGIDPVGGKRSSNDYTEGDNSSEVPAGFNQETFIVIVNGAAEDRDFFVQDS